MAGEESRGADEALDRAVVRVSGASGTIAGAGVLVAPDRVLTCAHVVSDALDRDRDLDVRAGTTVLVEFPLADGAGGQHFTAEVEHWIPEQPKHCGDVAVLRLPEAVPGTRPLPLAAPDDVSGRPVRVVGFPDGELGLVWHRGELSGRSSGDWLQLSRADTRTAHVTGGYSGSPVWDEQRGAAVGIVVAAQRKHDDTQQAFAISAKAVLEKLPDLARALTPEPFRGLATFQESHEGFFFGRDDDIEDVVTALKGKHPAVILYGPSGCGKSSLTLAGVIPAMRRRNPQNFDAVVVNAGAEGSVLSGLATHLYEGVRTGRYGDQRAASVAEIEDWLAGKGLVDTLNRLHGSTGGQYLVVLDQAEALLDRTERETEEAATLLFPQRRTGTGMRLLVTLRSDFMDEALKHPRLGALLHHSTTLAVTPMSRDQLSQVITKPLEKAPAVAYDPGLAQRILDDACREPENLPLLGFLLRQLWDQRFAGRLRTSTYEAIHGVQGALEEHCNEAWKQCVAEREQAVAARLLRGLVRVLPGSETPLRRRLTREEAGEAGWELARSFAERRLLVLRGGRQAPETAELAHEALINVWPALREQVQQDAKFLAGRAELDHDRDRWSREGRPPSLLPGSVQLAAIEHWLTDRERELSEGERDFLARARQRRRLHRNRVRAAWTAAAVVLALLAGLGTFLVYQQRVSTQREAESHSRLLANLSAEVAKRDPGRAALIAVGAYEIAPTDEARNAMLRRYDRFKDAAWVLTGAEGKIRNAATSGDGTVTLVTSANGRGTLFVRQGSGRIRQVQLSLATMAYLPQVSRDGRRIAYLSAAGTAFWHEVDRTAATPNGVLGKAHPLRGAAFRELADLAEVASEDDNLMAFSPDAGELATVSGRRLQLWDLATGRHRTVPGQVAWNQEALWFGQDENTLVLQTRSGTAESSVTAVDVGTGRARKMADKVDTSSLYGSAVGLSGDGTVLVVCREAEQAADDTKVYQALRVPDGRVLSRYTYTGPNSDCGSIAVDEQGERFAANTFRSWAVVDIRHGRRVRQSTTRAPEKTVGRLLRHGRQPLVLTLDEDKNALTALPLLPRDIDGADIVVNAPRLIGGGKTMLAHIKRPNEATKGETLALVDAASGRVTAEVKRPDSPVAPAPTAADSLAVNDAGTLVADRVGDNKVSIRQIPSLREVAEISTLKPPVDKAGNAERLTLTFLRDTDELLTRSGSRIEHWNARTGHHLSRPIDARTLQLGPQNPPLFGSTKEAFDSGFAVDTSPLAGYAQIMVRGEPELHAVNLRTGKENKTLRIRLGAHVERAFLDDSGRHAAAKTPGGMLELWSTKTGKEPGKVLGPLGPLGANSNFTGDGFTFGFTGHDDEFYLANAGSVRFQQLSDPSNFKTYDFATDQYFVAATKDGRTLVRTLSEGGLGGDEGGGRWDLIHLDPALWKRHLCDTVGHDLTQEERQGLPSGLPEVICPAR
ncbi:trypsin-like peptidase domain-containing protein [Streptomyces sp. NPDC049813]|uniref:nSTAND1 domain-containing NTPase n=1 Tax=Streptomyces sp. NPDC049813 TaxID=3365597 RepID=UPI00379FBE44